MSQMTKRALAASLKNLLRTKPLNQITINNITEACGVNRMTFYYHFSDIYDLLDWICEADVAKVLEGKNTYETWQEGFLNILLLVRENRQIVVNLCHSVSLERMELFLHKLIYDLIIDVVEEKAEGMVVRDEDKRYIADFYKYAIVGIMLNWIRNDMKDDPNQIVNSFYILISSNIPLALSYYRVDKTN